MTLLSLDSAVSLLICFLIARTSGQSPAYLPDDVSISCGSGGTQTLRDSREWIGDAHPRFTSLLQIKGSSTAFRGGSDPVPYKTARISRSRFSYTFSLQPGQKLIRLHFNPIPYMKRYTDLFTVETGKFVLLSRFSASVTVDALGVKSLVKEFCTSVGEHEKLEIIFSPESSQSCAFINAIEINSVPMALSYFGGGIRVVGQKYLVYIDNSTALEVVRRVHMKRDSGGDESMDVFGLWGAGAKRDRKEINNVTWNISLDVGFSYLVRIHFCEVGIKMAEIRRTNFTLLINGMITASTADVFKERDYNPDIPLHGDHLVIIKRPIQQRTADLSISLLSNSAFANDYGLLKGFEIYKLSNSYNSLGSPNPGPLPTYHPSRASHSFLVVFGEINAVVTIAIALVTLANIVIHCLRKTWEANPEEEKRKPSARAARLCHRFSLAEIRAATKGFSSELVLGIGGFGIVYKGLIHNGEETVAIKKLKRGSWQGENEFWTEIETLSQLRHVNLVPLIGYCYEQSNLILVYEYMGGGTLADRLYKLDMCSDNFLSWQCRLRICIGAGRGLDYLHTGYGVIHRDIKATNILLDEKLTAKIADFGLAKLDSTNDQLQSHVSTNVKGTHGYLDPNYINTRKLTQKSDTYSFGVVLLEVLCGRPAMDTRADDGKCSITKWAREMMMKGDVDMMVDWSLREEINPESLKTFLEIVEGCLHEDPKKRPTMAEVVLKLVLVLEQQERPRPLAPQVAAVAHPSNNVESPPVVSHGIVTTSSSQRVASPLKDQTRKKSAISEHPMDQKHENKTIRKQKPGQIWAWNSIWNRIVAFKRKRSADQQSSGYPSSHMTQTMYREHGGKPWQFLFSDLAAATNNFSLENKIGDGSFGVLYKGILPNGLEIAIKRSHILQMKKFRGKENAFESLPTYFWQVHHKHLVPLVGHSAKKDERLLVYEYMKNGSLNDHLHDMGNVQKSSSMINSWEIRIRIMLDSARGIEYLHTYVFPGIVHLNINSSNILLNANWSAQVSNFWLSFLWSENDTDCILTTCDVYGLGVVLLELLTGKRALFKTNSEGKSIRVVDYATPAIAAGELADILDPRVGPPEGSSESEALELVAYTAMHCVHLERKDRSMMTVAEIVGNLERALHVLETAMAAKVAAASVVESTVLENEMR